MSLRFYISIASASVMVAAVAPWRTTASAQGIPSDTGRSIVLPNAHEFPLRSAINGRDYRISIALPAGYRAEGKGDTTRYPVLYLLDGDMELPLVANFFRVTNRQHAGDVILVGIGYPSKGGFDAPSGPDGIPFRRIDYTPSPFIMSDSAVAAMRKDWPQSGGAPAFLNVIKQEVIPFVERRYRTARDRGLHGHSLGGLFAMYVLLTDPDLFDRYLITSPSLWWDGDSMFQREAAFAKTRVGLSKRVYFSIGDTEEPQMVAGMWRMVATLCRGVGAGYYKGLDVSAEALVDELHSSTVPINRALKAMYPPYISQKPSGPRYCGKLTPLPY